MNENERLGTQRLYALFERYPAVATDSRRAGEGTIFFALRGDRFDGNRFALAALDAGAACAVVDDPAVAASAGEAYAGRIVTVDDALAALQALACEHRRRLGIPLLAIVGSNGKTTTKELVSRVLAEKYAVYATQGNLNNHIGVPLTLLAMTRDTELGVVEMGASACGEIALLCAIAEPNFGLITNVGRAHLEGFGGVEGVRRGKGELYDYLAANGGRAFVRRDDGTLVKMAAERGNLAVELYDPAEESGKPQITLSEYLIHLELQQAFDPKDYLEQVNVDQMTYEKGEDDELHAVSAEDEILGEEKLSIENPVDTGKEGVYEVTYTVTSEEGQTSSIRLIVCVNQ